MLEKLNSLLWGYGTIALILLTGVFFTVKIGFFQLNLPKILKNTLFAKSEKASKQISRFQALSTALAASMGTGNIVGVAAAIAAGGPGAVFWMWISAIFGCGTTYAENYLGVSYKTKLSQRLPEKLHHRIAGDRTVCDRSAGAMLYLEHGLGSKAMAVVYAGAAVLASFGVGNMTQSNAIAGAVSAVLPPFTGVYTDSIVNLTIGIITAFLAGCVNIGGVKRIAAASEKIIPIISVFYITGAIIVICLNLSSLPHVFAEIISGAFGVRAVGGGISGTLIKNAVTVGLKRGIFSNEAGMGSSVLVHTETDCKDGGVMGMWAILEVFIDTILCCTLTALVILCTRTQISSDTLTAMSSAFAAGLGKFAGAFISISTVIFAFATILGWCFYGEKSVNYLSERRSIKLGYKIFYIILIAVGAVVNTSALWGLSDIFNALMLIPNLIGILYLSREVKKP